MGYFNCDDIGAEIFFICLEKKFAAESLSPKFSDVIKVL